MSITAMLRLAAAVVLLVSGMVVAGVAPAASAPTWLHPVDLSAAPYARSARVATDPQGNATVVWSSWEDQFPGVIQTASRPAGGGWSEPVVIARSTTTLRQSPNLVVDQAGNVTAVWVAEDVRPGNPGPTRSTYRIQAVTRAADGAWSAPVDISLISDAPIASVSVVVDLTGFVTAVWSRPASDGQAVESASRPLDGAWSAPVAVALGDAPSVAVAPDGEVTAVWFGDTGTGAQVRVASRPRGGTWSSPTDLTGPDGNRVSPDVAVDGAGTATVVWRDLEDNVISTSSETDGGTWTIPLPLSSGTPGSDPSVAADPGGQVWAVWAEYNGSTRFIRAARRTSDGYWSPPANLSPPTEDAAGPAVTASSEGSFVVTWTRFDGSSSVVIGARATGTSSWDKPFDISAGNLDARRQHVAIDASGNAVAVWDVGGVDGGLVQAAGLDATGPVLGGYAVPATGTVGQSLDFSASAVDAWSPVTSYAWSFGDGATANGGEVAHAYGAEGRYAVSLTVTDNVGNSTTRPTTVTVVAPPPVAPRITRFRLTKPSIRVLDRALPTTTRLKVRLNAAATLRVVFTSAHQWRIDNRRRRHRVVLTKKLPVGPSSIVVRARVDGERLYPDTYVLSGRAKNSTGFSSRKRARLEVIQP